jgi:hypothetical protein
MLQKYLLDNPLENSSIEFVVREAPNWPSSAGLLYKSFYPTWAAIALVVGLYGSLHAAAWNSHFPSDAEKVLWRVSSIIVAISGFLAFAAVAVDRLPSLGRESYFRTWDDRVQRCTSFIESIWLGLQIFLAGLFMLVIPIPLVVSLLVYIPARIYLVLDAFLSLRSAPVELYQTPNWTQWIPHL